MADGGDVGGAARFKRDVDDGFAEADAVVSAVVHGFDDVGALAGQDLGEREQCAGAVLQVDTDAEQAAIFHQAALDDFGQQADVDVAAGDHHHGAAMAESGFGLDDRGKGCGSGALGEGLLLFEEHEDGAGDFFVVDGDDFVDVVANHGQGEVAGASDGDAIGDGGLGGDGDGVSGLASAEHGGKLFRLDADDADSGIGLIERAGEAADEPAAADGDDDGFDVGDLLEQFEADGALAGDDLGVVEGVDEGAAFFNAAAQGLFAGFVVAGAEENDLGAVGAGGGDLGLRSGERHDDLGADGAGSGGEGDTLGVVSGAGRDDAALAFGLAERQQLVERASFLERAGALEVFKLEVQGQAGELGEVVRELAGRHVNGLADAGAGCLDAG